MKNVLLVLVALVAIVMIVIATRPPRYHVERSASMAASPGTVYANVADFHRWAAWSPWEKLDPGMKTDFDGPPGGVGASYHWIGNDKVGEGRMTITDATPDQRAVMKLEFLKPWQSTCTTTFSFAPEGQSTRVTWAMDGTNNFMAKAMSLVMNMDKMIGPDFERGLASLRTVSEADTAKAATATP
jgi:polyketide cyclase/dehydrase/lipid transport protein